MATFSILTVCLMAMGWASHWLMVVRKAREAARVAGREHLPDLLDYWRADWPSTWLSLIGVVAGYFVIPHIAARWPELAVLIGATETDPMNPLAAYLGGLAAPSFADWSGRRLARMVA